MSKAGTGLEAKPTTREEGDGSRPGTFSGPHLAPVQWGGETSLCTGPCRLSEASAKAAAWVWPTAPCRWAKSSLGARLRGPTFQSSHYLGQGVPSGSHLPGERTALVTQPSQLHQCHPLTRQTAYRTESFSSPRTTTIRN